MSVNFPTAEGNIVLGVSIGEVDQSNNSNHPVNPPVEPSEPFLIPPTPLGALSIN